MPDKCLKCGACCRSLIVEATWIDVEREPRIEEECEMLDVGVVGRALAGGPSWSVAVGRTIPCPFLRLVSNQEFRCDIYSTRPNECVAFEPGGEKCHQVRRDAGLEPDEKEPNDA